jgi:type I restriction enzyme M protein
MLRKPTNTTANGNGKRHATQQSVNAAIKSICDVMRRSNCAGAMKYVPELTWILFLRILDERETQEADEADALGIPFAPTIKKPYRWRDWAAPGCALRQDTKASVWKFVHEELLPYLKGLKDKRGATPRQKVISQVMAGVERSRIDSEKSFLDVSWTRSTKSPTRRWIPPTYSRCHRSMRACCSKWARRATMAASSSPRAKSSA